MLKGIDPILPPDLLAHARAMGHGDTLVIADANFPAARIAQRLVRMDGHSATRVLDAILSLLPLDANGGPPACHMQVIDAPTTELPIFEEFRALIARHQGAGAARVQEPVLAGLERFAFYDAAISAYLIVATGERRLYGNIILRKGVILEPSHST